MILKDTCKKCGKPARIQSEFKFGNLVHYVWQCGHLELRKPLREFNEQVITPKLDAIQVTSIKPLEAYANAPNPASYLSWLLPKITSKPPEPTHKELYDDLDRWVSEGGLVKGQDLQANYINPKFFSIDNSKCAYEFQRDGVAFAESTQLNCLIADAMGLGKTIQALITLKRNWSIVTPVAIFVRGATIFQWTREFKTWVNNTEFNAVIPVTSRLHLIPGFKVYVISMDLLARKGVLELLEALKLKTVILDEVQNFKDTEAKRTKALVRLIKSQDIQFKIALSGTPIKNRADEYFTILNILAPNHFYSLADFRRYWLIQNEKGVYTRLNPLKADKFKELTSRWIIRRERHDVLKNLPALTRDYQVIEIDDPQIRSSYNSTLDLFGNFLRNTAKINSQELLGWLAKLRAITGQAKCKNAIEWTQDFLESTDESVAIGIQHHAVRDALYYVFDACGLNPLKFSGEDSVYRKADIVQRFTNGDNRILVINSLAGGVGLNLQTCANALVLERQWNSADEEQFEARFHRDGQRKAVTITYMIAKGTIDEFFHEMVIKKRKILHDTGIGTELDLNTDMDSLLELSEQIVTHRI